MFDGLDLKHWIEDIFVKFTKLFLDLILFYNFILVYFLK